MDYKAYIIASILITSVIAAGFVLSSDFTITGAAIGLSSSNDAVKDAELRSSSNKKNYGVSENLNVGKNNRNIIFEFDLSSLPVNSTIQGATLKLFVTDATEEDETASVDVYRLTRSWAEGTGDGQQTNDGATWKYYNNQDNWDNSGGDYDEFIWSEQAVTEPDAWYEWNILNLVRSWSNGTYDNYGILLLTESNNVGRKSFASSENNNISLIPQLILNYSTPPALSNINATDISYTTANIIWNTDDASNSTVNYGLTTALGTLSVNSDLETTHNVGLSNLQDNLTIYYYQVESCNSQNLCTESSLSTFVTLENITAPEPEPELEPELDTTAPTIDILFPQSASYDYNNMNITYTAEDNVQLNSCWYKLDSDNNVTLANCNNLPEIEFSEAQHTLYVYAEDNSSNVGSDSIIFIIELADEQSQNPIVSSSGGSPSGGSSSSSGTAASGLTVQTAQPAPEGFVENSNENTEAQSETNANLLTGGAPINVPVPEATSIMVALILISLISLFSYIHPEWLKFGK